MQAGGARAPKVALFVSEAPRGEEVNVCNAGFIPELTMAGKRPDDRALALASEATRVAAARGGNTLAQLVADWGAAADLRDFTNRIAAYSRPGANVRYFGSVGTSTRYDSSGCCDLLVQQ